MESKFLQDLKDRDSLLTFIKEWNESRLDMFALSQPNERLQFSGVMRFYFQETGQKAATKCIRVNNEQTVADLMATLTDKFCPDLKMLSTPNYELYEIHGTGDVTRLDSTEKPLLVQLLWHLDDREGRFVLKSADLKIQPVKFFEINKDEGQLKRRLSRREKKDLKKKRKEELARSKNQDKLLADHVYRELPESSLTRTISNPEAVMRRRRQQKLEKRMKEFQNKGGPQTGGILKIFAESLKPEIPYKTILASVKDNADVITKSALEKFLLPNENPQHFCIIMAIIPPGDPGAKGNVKERVIRSSDCPLAIQNSWPRSKGVITFHLRRKEGAPAPTVLAKEDKRPKDKPTKSAPPVNKKTESKNKPPPLTDLPPNNENINYDMMPFFLELTPEGKEINYKPKIYHIRPHETVIGSCRNPSPGVQYLQLFSPKILASHCSIVNEDGCVSIVPHGQEADVRVSGKRIYDTMILQSGNTVQFGGLHTFRFCNPMDDPQSERSSIASDQDYRNYYGSQGSKGVSPPMSPISPELKERILNEQIGSQVDDDLDADQITETTFGVGGEVEMEKIPRTMFSARSAENLLDEETVQMRASFRNSFKKHRQSAPNLYNMNISDENLLPASLTFLDHGKDAFFATVINGVNGAAVNFKLAPTYTLYLAARHVLSPSYRPGISPLDRSRLLTGISKKIASSIQQTIQENDCLAGGLAFWMANASELLHFYRQDMDLGPLTQTAQSILAQSIQESFALLVNAMEDELALALPAFLDPTESVDIHERDLDSILNDDILERAESMELLNWTSEDDDRTFRMGANGQPVSGDQWITPAARIRNHGMPVMADVLYILSSAMSLLRRCRVNAALTIQLFSQLFHYINMWIFNRIVLEPELNLCTSIWGHRLRMRLSFVEAWAERQGLELAADCHLARVVQAAYLLEAPKDSAEDIADISSQCFKLNSLQLRCLLQNYMPDRDEPIIPQDLIETIVAVAENTADELTHSDGRDVKLEEDVQLQLPFLLPEEGYSSDIIRGVPPGLQEFLEPLCGTGLCELSLNPSSMGLWTVYQEPYELEDDSSGNRDSQLVEELPIQRITIDKGKSGLGLSICSAKGLHSDFPGIYVKAVIEGGLAYQDGRLEGGDQILSVNESSLIDVTQTQAAKIMGKSGSVITLEVMKRAAFYHGLAKLVEGVPSHKKENSVDDGRSRQKSVDATDVGHFEQFRDPPIPQREPYKEPDKYQQPPPPVSHQLQQQQKFDHRHAHSFDGSEQRIQQQRPEHNHRHTGSYDGSEQRVQQHRPEHNHRHTGSYDGLYYDDRNQPRQQELVSHPSESDYDSDGNLMTPEEKSRRERQLQRQREYEERLAKWEADRLKKEQEEQQKLEQQAEEEAERAYEEEVRRAKEEARQEEEIHRENERIRLEEEERLREDEKRRLEERRREESIRRAEEKRREDDKRKRAEEEKRREEENERRRVEEEKRREGENERRRIEEEKRREEEKRHIEEKRRVEEERLLAEAARIDAERKQAEINRREGERRREEEYRMREEERRQQEERDRREAEEQRRRLDSMRAEEIRKREEEEQERRRKEKLRLIEERKHKEAEEADERRIRREQVQRENEDKHRKLYEEEQARRQADERARKQEAEKLRRQEEEDRARKEEASRNNSYSNPDLDEDMAGIDEALREAEKIAAEMDLFMMEEVLKIEETKQQKREEEKKQWKTPPPSYNTSKPRVTQPERPIQKTYRIETKIKRTSSRENLLETDLDNIDSLPPPPEELLSNDDNPSPIRHFETNIDESSDEESPARPSYTPQKNNAAIPPKQSNALLEQQKWLQEQKERKERQRQEQERLRNEYSNRGNNVNAAPPPAVRPKSFKPPTVNNNLPVRMEFKMNLEDNTSGYESPKISQTNNTDTRKSSSEDDAPPRPPPPKSVTPSPRTPQQFAYSATNGLQDGGGYQRTASFGKRPSYDYNAINGTAKPTINRGTDEPEVMDFRTKMKMFNKFQNN